MQIGFNDYTSFQAKFIIKAKIKKKTLEEKYRTSHASLVELEPNKNYNDLKCLGNIFQKWKHADYTGSIYDDAIYMANMNSDHIKFYALTTQKRNIRNLNPNKVIAICDINEITKKSEIGKHGFVEYIQIHPDSIYKENYIYKNIGSGFIKGLQKIYDKINLQPINRDKVRNFYYKNGFKKISDRPEEFEWKNDKY